MSNHSQKPEITSEMISEAYDAAKNIYNKHISRKEALIDLTKRTQINQSSAGYCINGFKKMMDGERYTGTMNEEGTDYFLTKIMEDYGPQKLENALSAVRQHLDYYSDKRKISLHGIHNIVNKHENLLKGSNFNNYSPNSTPDFFTVQEIEFLKKWANQKYDKTDKKHFAAKNTLIDTVWSKAQYWSNEVVKKLPDYEVSNPRIWSKPGYKGSYFKDYAWARIFKKGDKDKDIFFTVSASASNNEALVYKLDYHHAKDSKLTREQQEICEKHIPEEIKWVEISKDDLSDWDWKSLIDETVKFISQNSTHYDQIIELVFNQKPPEDIFKNSLTQRDIPKNISQPKSQKPSFSGQDIDFEKQQRENKELGDKGEELVKNLEIERLKTRGLLELSEKVEIVKDGRGFDVLSFDEYGNEIHIEVKTTTGGGKTSFFMSRNEKLFFELNPQNYKIYRLYNYDKTNNNADFFIIEDPSLNLKFEPTMFEVRLS